MAAEDAISAALPFRTLITGFWPPPKAFSVEEISRHDFHNLTITTKPLFFTTKPLKITTKCSIFTIKHSKITTKAKTFDPRTLITGFCNRQKPFLLKKSRVITSII